MMFAMSAAAEEDSESEDDDDASFFRCFVVEPLTSFCALADCLLPTVFDAAGVATVTPPSEDESLVSEPLPPVLLTIACLAGSLSELPDSDEESLSAFLLAEIWLSPVVFVSPGFVFRLPSFAADPGWSFVATLVADGTELAELSALLTFLVSGLFETGMVDCFLAAEGGVSSLEEVESELSDELYFRFNTGLFAGSGTPVDCEEGFFDGALSSSEEDSELVLSAGGRSDFVTG